MKALLRLFNAVQVTDHSNKETNDLFVKHAISNGYVLSPDIDVTEELLKKIDSVIGLNGKQLNQSFHKSWGTIKNTPRETLVLQQIIHYITTYGFESLGIYSKDTVYIPNEILEVLEITKPLSLVVIKGLTKEEIFEKVVIIGCGAALSEDTLKDIVKVVKDSRYDCGILERINNFELKIRFYDYYQKVPKEPVDYLRYLIYKLTGETLIIKNKQLINKIKESEYDIDNLLNEAPDNLASIFYRYKPLFLAMKTVKNKTFFNKLRKRAIEQHEPMKEDYLNSITAQIKRNELDINKLHGYLKSASVFRKIRLLNALRFRLIEQDAIVYRVRNGRGYATTFKHTKSDGTLGAYKVVINSIIQNLNVKNKVIYIPEHISYALPVSDKQFTGNIPNGTYIKAPDSLVVGVHWFNNSDRVDLDLSLLRDTGKIGWDSRYSTKGNEIMFSGDMTDAPEPLGAAEFFYFKNSIKVEGLLLLNYYNYEKEPVKYKLIVGKETKAVIEKNYMLSPNKVTAIINMEIKEKQNIIGLVTNINGANRVYLTNVSIGDSITSSNEDYIELTRRHMINSLKNSIRLEPILMDAGAKIVKDRPEGTYLDLSLESVDKTTLLELITK
jgi:hypothetical protein